jgi:Flp pilus assembly protein TadG
MPTTAVLARACRRCRPVGLRGERGSASVQLAVLLPVMFGVMFLGLQAALVYHARTVAVAAATEGARAAAAEHGTAGDGATAAAGFLADAGGADVLERSAVTANRAAGAATVTVTGTALTVLPGWHPHIEQSATLPTERITR